MKHTMKLLGIIIASMALVACGGGGGNPPVKTEKVWKLKEKVLPTGEQITFDYDGSGNVIRQNNKTSGTHVEFNYDDKGVLLTREDFHADGKLRYHTVFDSHGEPKSRAGPSLVPGLIYDNTYDDDRVVPDEASKRNNTETYANSYLRVYPASKLVSRARSGGLVNRIEKYSYEGNTIYATFFKSDDSISDVISKKTFDENANIVRHEGDEDGERGPKEVRLYYTSDYTYDYDGNSNLKSSTLKKADGSEEITTYKWEQIDVPVQ
ncbi:MAG: hypothetical protein L3J51_05705 [Cocleimonas sp.]|nr:hypothetical protein [Cocleimonas sp.]